MSETAAAEQQQPLPSVDELKEGLEELEDASTQEAWIEDFYAHSADQEAKYVRLQALRDHFAHKGKWSYFLMFLMFVLVAFQCVLLGLVGGKVWDFREYDWLLPLLLVQNFAQIVGLAVFVVRSLFGAMDRGDTDHQ